MTLFNVKILPLPQPLPLKGGGATYVDKFVGLHYARLQIKRKPTGNPLLQILPLLGENDLRAERINFCPLLMERAEFQVEPCERLKFG